MLCAGSDPAFSMPSFVNFLADLQTIFHHRDQTYRRFQPKLEHIVEECLKIFSIFSVHAALPRLTVHPSVERQADGTSVRRGEEAEQR